MATKASPRGRNEPEPRPIIVKKVIEAGHGGHHGGAWKVAYADFVTAMMAFFLLLWLLGMTDEEKRKGHSRLFHADAGRAESRTAPAPTACSAAIRSSRRTIIRTARRRPATVRS
jgi:flagellar motor protein MotB